MECINISYTTEYTGIVNTLRVNVAQLERVTVMVLAVKFGSQWYPKIYSISADRDVGLRESAPSHVRLRLAMHGSIRAGHRGSGTCFRQDVFTTTENKRIKNNPMILSGQEDYGMLATFGLL